MAEADFLSTDLVIPQSLPGTEMGLHSEMCLCLCVCVCVCVCVCERERERERVLTILQKFQYIIDSQNPNHLSTRPKTS